MKDIHKLHTKALSEKYGPITVNVLKHTSRVRETLLIDKRGISRTYALTILQTKEWTEEIRKINEDIKKGLALGREFRRNKYDTRKNIIDVYNITIPPWLRNEFDTKETRAKARLSEFLVKNKTDPAVLYGIVVEIFTPHFQKAGISTHDINKINATSKALKKKSITDKEIWSRLDKGTSWDDVYEKVVMAKALSLPEVIKYKKKIESQINKKRKKSKK